SINTENSGGVVEGEVRNSGCDFILEVKNPQPYWANLRVTPVGSGLELTPDGDLSTSLMGYRVIPPLGSIFFRANFAVSEQSVTVLLDSTASIDEGARQITYA